MEQKINISKATEHCSCSACFAKNYIGDERFDTKVDTIFEVRIGTFCNRLCASCCKALADMLIHVQEG